MANTFPAAKCHKCGHIAYETRAGWRHGWPPNGDDGHCPGTGVFPSVSDRVAKITR